MSEKFSLNGIDFQKIGKGALIALAGAGIAFLGQLSGMDFGSWTVLVGAMCSVAVNALNKFIQGNK